MATRMSKKYYIIPFLYISIIILLVYMQFSNEKEFSDNHLSIALTGLARNIKDTENNLKTLKTSMSGFSFSFRNSQDIEIRDSDGNRSGASLSGYRKNRESLDILFSGGCVITLTPDRDNPGGFLLGVTLPPEKRGATVTLPFGVEGEAPEKGLNFPVIGFKSKEGFAFLSIPENGGHIDHESEKIVLITDNSALFQLRISPYITEHTDPVSFWLSEYGKLSRAENESSAEQQLIDTAYRVWRTERLDRTEGKWRDISGTLSYSPEIVSALGSEVFRRREYSANQWIFQLARAKNSSDRLELALISGGTIPAYRRMQQDDLEMIEKIAVKIKNSDSSVFESGNPVSLLIDRGPYSLLHELFLLAEKLDIKKMDLKTAVAAAEAYLEFVNNDIEKEKSIERLNRITDKKILSSLVRENGSLFMISEGSGNSETVTAVKAAQILVKSSEITGRKVLKQIGEKIVSSVILHADESGYLPEFFYRDSSGAVRGGGKIGAEFIYPALESSEYLPRITSLKNEVTPGTWIATCAKVESAVLSGNSLAIDTVFPQGETENIILQGIPSVSGILLYGVNWNTAADYERYFAGWVFSAESQTLFIKLQHRQERERIVINF